MMRRLYTYAASELGAEVLERMPQWFEDIDPIKPSILHGDLWSGNIGTVDGEPSAFDPAVYYGGGRCSSKEVKTVDPTSFKDIRNF